MILQVPDALQSLCLADQHVRKGVFGALKLAYNASEESEEKSDLAVQLAFCKKVGFGTDKDVDAAALYLRDAETFMPDRNLSEYLDNAILSSRDKKEPSNPLLKRLYDTGVILPVHNAVDFRRYSETQQEAMRKARKEEYENMQMSLGPTHPAVLNLKWTFSTMLMESGELEPSADLRKRSDFLQAILDDLARDAAYGENHIDTITTEAYYALALNITPSFAAREESVDRCRRILRRLREVGRDNHVIAAMTCQHLSATLGSLLRFKDAERYLAEAKKRTGVIFGEHHENTVRLLIDEARNFAMQGNLSKAEAKQRECLNRMIPLTGENSKAILPLQGGLVDFFVAFSEFEKANKELLCAKEILNHHGFYESHPGYMIAHRSAVIINIGLGKFQAACEDADKCLAIMKKVPWPPPTNFTLPDIPDPSVFPRDPSMMVIEAFRSVALVALHHEAVAAGQHKEAASAEKMAEKCLEQLLREINQCRGLGGKTSGSASNAMTPSGSHGWANSPMYRAMEEGWYVPIELLTVVGADNARDGLHYDMAIRVARRLGMDRPAGVLEEHQALCSPPSATVPRVNHPFAEPDDLASWITGYWRGTYLSKQGGPRKGLKWKRTLSLQRCGNRDMEVEGAVGSGLERTLGIEGTADDEEAGSWTIRGKVSTSGKISLFFHLTNVGKEEHAWEYTGLLRPDHAAFGGHYRAQGLDHTQAAGTFFFYKD